MKHVLFVEFHNIHPHVEAAFELVKRHLDEGDAVEYVFLGHDVPYREFIFPSRVEATLFRPWLPERRAARLVDHPNLTFVGRGRLPLHPLPFPVPGTLEELKACSYEGFDVGMAVASSLISGYLDSRVDPSARRREVEDALRGAIAVFEYTRRRLAEKRPDLVYVFNGRIAHPRAVLRACEQAGVEVLVHERGATKDRFVVRPFMPHDRKRIQEAMGRTWAEVTDRDEAASIARGWYQERREGAPSDWYSFTNMQQSALLPDLPEGKRVIGYFSSSDDEYAAIGELFQWKGWSDQIDAVRDLIDTVSDRDGDHLVLRIHPHVAKKHPDERRRWLTLGTGNPYVTVVPPESPVDTYALVEACDVVVTGGSTVGMEATYWGTPSVLLGPSDYDQLGAVHVVRGHEQLCAALAREHLEVEPEDALPYAYYRATFGEEFRFFEAESLNRGRFMSVELHRLPAVPRALYRARKWLFRVVRDALGVTDRRVT